MADKSIMDLPEITSVGLDDYLVVETAAGTRRIKRRNVSVAGRLAPLLVQKATLRGDGTIALPAPPTIGNLMILVMAGYSPTSLPGTYKPRAFTSLATYQSDTNNAVSFANRRVVSGDTGSYNMSTTDNQAAVLYEFANAAGVYPIVGGAMSGQFSGTSFALTAPISPYGADDINLIAFTHDTTPVWSLTAETGLSIDFLTPADGQNHTSAFASYGKSFDQTIAGGLTGSPVNPAFGMAAVVGISG